MRIRRMVTTGSCSIRTDDARFHRQCGLLQNGHTDWLLHLGLTCDEIKTLDIRQPLLQEIFEYAGIRPGVSLSPSEVVETLEATKKVLADHTQDLDLQIWMLQRRRDSLTNKSLVVERLLRVLKPASDRKAA